MRENGIDVIVKNNSESPIENVKFYTTEKKDVVEFDKINSNQSVRNFLSMEKNESDGGYVLDFIRANGETESGYGGYYTNGGSLNTKITFEVLMDTVIVSMSDY